MAKRNDYYDRPDQIIEDLWPYDGPHSADSVEAAAAALPRLVRYLNNATSYGSTLSYAASAYRVTSNLASMAGLLPQVLEQLARFLDRQAGDPGLYDDRRDDRRYSAALTAATAALELHDAARAANQLCTLLQHAARSASHLGNDDPAEVSR